MGASTSTYVRSLSVNGRPSPADWVSAGHLSSLAFTLGATASPTWGTRDEPPSYPAGPLRFPPGRKPTILVPTGPNLLGPAATGDLGWQGPVQNGVGSVPGTLAPTTTATGASAIHWTETSAGPDSWIWVDPAAQLPGGQSYQVSISLAGTGDVHLDFWNGQTDLNSATVTLTATPQTLTLQGAVPSAADTHLRAGDFDWTVLGPSRLTLEPATGRIAVGREGAEKAEVSREDVALVVAAVLSDDATIGQTIEFNNGDLPIAEALATSGDRKRGEAGRSGSPPSIR